MIVITLLLLYQSFAWLWTHGTTNTYTHSLYNQEPIKKTVFLWAPDITDYTCLLSLLYFQFQLVLSIQAL